MQLIGQVFYYLTLAILGVESLTYSGFLEKHTRVSVWILLIIVGLFSKIIPWEKINRQIKDLYLYVFIGGWLTLTILDCSMYPNFVYSHFHINLESTSLFIGLLLWPRVVKYLNKQSIFIILAGFISLLYMLPALQSTLASGLSRNKHELGHLNKSYDEKMAEEYGPSYYYYKFVVENTPSEARIIIPPQAAPWIRTGNALLSRYFLGTRVLINGGTDGIISLENVDYVMISSETVNSGSPYMLWPGFKINSKEIISFNPETKAVSILSSFDPIYFSQNKLWGLIKINK